MRAKILSMFEDAQESTVSLSDCIYECVKCDSDTYGH